MDALSVGSRGSRGSLYPVLGDVDSLDAPEAIEVFSKGGASRGGRARRRHRRQKSRDSPLGIQIVAGEMENIDDLGMMGPGEDVDDDSEDEKPERRRRTYHRSRRVERHAGDNISYDDDNESGSIYGEFKLKDEDDYASVNDDNRSIGASVQSGRSIRSGRSAKSYHTNPGVFKNSKAPRAKREDPEQKKAADLLNYFENNVTNVRSFSAGNHPQRSSSDTAVTSAVISAQHSTPALEQEYRAMLKIDSGQESREQVRRSRTRNGAESSNFPASATRNNANSNPGQPSFNQRPRSSLANNPLAQDYKRSFAPPVSQPAPARSMSAHASTQPRVAPETPTSTFRRSAAASAAPRTAQDSGLVREYKNEFTSPTISQPAPRRCVSAHESTQPRAARGTPTGTSRGSTVTGSVARTAQDNSFVREYKNSFASNQIRTSTDKPARKSSSRSTNSSAPSIASTVASTPRSSSSFGSPMAIENRLSGASSMAPVDFYQKRNFEDAVKKLQPARNRSKTNGQTVGTTSNTNTLPEGSARMPTTRSIQGTRGSREFRGSGVSRKNSLESRVGMLHGSRVGSVRDMIGHFENNNSSRNREDILKSLNQWDSPLDELSDKDTRGRNDKKSEAKERTKSPFGGIRGLVGRRRHTRQNDSK